jgi:cation-transporting P-type ATPase F
MLTIPSVAELSWHQLPADRVLELLSSSPDLGLNADEVANRYSDFGSNELVGKKGKPGWLKFILQFNQPLLIILVCAGAIKAMLGEWLNAGVIWGVTTTNAIISYFQEAQAEEAIASLASSIVTEATVIRAGSKTKLPSSQLVPGDIVLLASGDKVPADLRLLKTRDLQIDESALTGESIAVAKEVAADSTLAAETPLAERTNMAYAGGFVTFGQGMGIVVATGSRTETGKISSLLEQRADLTTPLTRKFNQFSQNWLFFVLGMATLTFAVGLGQRSFNEAIEAAVALIVGAIPEGLPAVITVTLAIGVARMARRHAIIRKLPAVETLGSATVICSDKTGTLTENQMTVQEIYAGGIAYSLTGQGYAPTGNILQGTGAAATPQLAPNAALRDCLLAGLLCNDSQLDRKDGKWSIVGDPTEGALITAGLKAGMLLAEVSRSHPRIDTLPFESQFQYMATLHSGGDAGQPVIYIKGSAEALLPRCTACLDGDGNPVRFDRQSIEAQLDSMAGQGLRVLTFAKKLVPATQRSVNHEDLDSGLLFLGLQGSIDPPRAEAIAAVRACQSAGIQVKMITGDYIKTATAIAHRMGFRKNRQTIVAYTGAELARMSPAELANAVTEGVVFARVVPEQKLRLVEALQSRGEIVAMTGDGVNDAPALKQADIGIAMGSGTEVSKEAADMILTDDNFASIGSAVEEGRSVYKNLIKAICFILPVNGGESMTILISTLLGRELPILSLQILWLNMLNSITMTVPLSFEPKSEDVMKHPPRPATEQFLTANRMKRILAVSLYNWTLIFGMFEWVRQAPWGSLELARTMAIQALVMGRIIYLLSISQLLPSLIAKLRGSIDEVKGAPALAIGLLAAMTMQIAFSNLAFINDVFKTAPMSLAQWSICIGASLPMMAIATLANRFDPPN